MRISSYLAAYQPSIRYWPFRFKLEAEGGSGSDDRGPFISLALASFQFKFIVTTLHQGGRSYREPVGELRIF